MGLENSLKYIAELRDPRVERTREHLLEEILLTRNAAVLAKGFAAWAPSIARLTAGEVIASDGKSLCGTRKTGKKTASK